jgi:hypothetical protein
MIRMNTVELSSSGSHFGTFCRTSRSAFRPKIGVSPGAVVRGQREREHHGLVPQQEEALAGQHQV